jgi:hypothetical protein
MSQDMVQGKALTAVARDIAEGYAALNPLMMKNFTTDTYRALYQRIRKIQTEVRSEKFPFHDVESIRRRNLRLQRIHQALNVLQYAAKQRKILLA